MAVGMVFVKDLAEDWNCFGYASWLT
jgi:hypothetical protein